MRNDTLLYITPVVSVEDKQDGGRIKVCIKPMDNRYDKPKEEDLAYAFPLLPKHLHVNPQVGELVVVIFQHIENGQTNRFYIGPIISQPYRMGYDPTITAENLLAGVHVGGNVKQRVEMDPLNRGTLPIRTDIALEGRYNSDVVLKDSEVRIRCGYKKDPENGAIDKRLNRNERDQAYIQMKYGPSRDAKGNDYSSITNIVSDRINLLSHDSPDYFDLNDPEKLMSDETIDEVFRKAHPVVYGDVLVAYLKKLVEIFRTHSHPFAMDPPCLDSTQAAAINPGQLESMLSQSIRVN